MSKAPRRFEQFRRRAESLVSNPGRVQKLLDDADRKQSTAGGSKIREMRDQLSTAIALVKAWVAGDYRQVSNKTIVILVAALLYFVMPLDVIPDFLFGLGFLDDATVLVYAFSQLKGEIAAFEAWQKQPLDEQQSDKT
ncbi:MAG: YkvA family protein [Pseudomonadaceae bacterium]|nr:YkvA family protein [Pseudomonadaceae bacterium]